MAVFLWGCFPRVALLAWRLLMMKTMNKTNEYEVENGIIRSPGKFEGEPVYAPYFWDAYLNGMADDDDGSELLFYVSDEDRKLFPDLHDVSHVYLRETSDGFVCTRSILTFWSSIAKGSFSTSHCQHIRPIANRSE